MGVVLNRLMMKASLDQMALKMRINEQAKDCRNGIPSSTIALQRPSFGISLTCSRSGKKDHVARVKGTRGKVIGIDGWPYRPGSFVKTLDCLGPFKCDIITMDNYLFFLLKITGPEWLNLRAWYMISKSLI